MSDLPTGTRLGGYRVAAVLGRGGNGVVYLAQQLALGRRVALKVIDPGLSGDPEFRERFMPEARLAAAIDHPAVVPVYDAGEVEGGGTAPCGACTGWTSGPSCTSRGRWPPGRPSASWGR